MFLVYYLFEFINLKYVNDLLGLVGMWGVIIIFKWFDGIKCNWWFLNVWVVGKEYI